MANHGTNFHDEVVAALIDLAARDREVENPPRPKARGNFSNEFMLENFFSG